MTLAKNLMSGSLTENCKQDNEGFEINLKKDYSLSDLIQCPQLFAHSADEYYSVPYKSTMWEALEEAGAEKQREKIIAAVPGDTNQEKLDFLSKCNCCERHNTNKPGSLNDPCSGGSRCTDVDPGCYCSCRHTARFIVRANQK